MRYVRLNRMCERELGVSSSEVFDRLPDQLKREYDEKTVRWDKEFANQHYIEHRVRMKRITFYQIIHNNIDRIRMHLL